MSTEILVEEVQSVVLERGAGISTTTCICKFWNSQPTMFPLRAIKFRVSYFYSKLKTSLDAKMQQKIDSNTKKHHNKYT